MSKWIFVAFESKGRANGMKVMADEDEADVIFEQMEAIELGYTSPPLTSVSVGRQRVPVQATSSPTKAPDERVTPRNAIA